MFSVFGKPFKCQVMPQKAVFLKYHVFLVQFMDYIVKKSDLYKDEYCHYIRLVSDVVPSEFLVLTQAFSYLQPSSCFLYPVFSFYLFAIINM